MCDSDLETIYKKISLINYLSNSYRYLIKAKTIHFILILIEILLNIIQELDIFIKDFNQDNKEINSNKLNFISFITLKYNKLKKSLKIIILILIVCIFDCLYLLLNKKNFTINNIFLTIIVNILELFYFRIFMLIFFKFLFSFNDVILIILIILFSPHIYLIINNFSYHHLYYFVPEFINYPYDEFSSSFDIILFIIKLLLSICYSSKNSLKKKYFFIILIFFQIIFSFYFLDILIDHSYLFIKNSFLNKTRFCLFLSNSIILILAILVGKNEIITIFFF